MDFEFLYNKILEDKRILFNEVIWAYDNLSLPELGMLASIVRRRKNPESKVTYIIDRNINYTNVCVAGCKFCAFYRKKGDNESYVLSFDQIGEKIKETQKLGGVQILLQGGLHPDLGLSYYKELFRYIKENYNIWIHGLSPPEIIHITKIEGKSIEFVLQKLRKYGLDSIPGGGAEILTDRMRAYMSGYKCSVSEWLEVMETAHKIGLRTTATMMFGSVETIEERIEHLERLRELQDKTGGFTAFIPWSFQPENTQLKNANNKLAKATAHEYLKMLAISRIYLDNFKNIQVSWVTQGSKIAQIALEFGGNDFGSLMIEENVVKAAGVDFRMTIDEMEYCIKEAGYTPEKRVMIY
ncbi:MAG: dehypoxanthine futalosine cyclase [Candidatus Delongbacteria bacterium]|nr:dehypoxanthine futalosine cyclase [Candidatus Delongbacteria bacterium]MBN2836182.1 dehypoxanthine futalosine cyclase [Candidatus Delongbacteria bacterium]